MRRIIGAVATLALLGTATSIGDVTWVAASGAGCTVWTESNTDSEPGPAPGLPALTSLPPQIDLTSETMSSDGTTLSVQLHVVDMEKTVPLGTEGWEWTASWAVGNASPSVTANYSAADGSTTFLLNGLFDQLPTAVTGSIVTGAGGYVEIDVPLSLLGYPMGTVLSENLANSTALLTDSDGVTVTSPAEPHDHAGPGVDYALGQGCA